MAPSWKMVLMVMKTIEMTGQIIMMMMTTTTMMMLNSKSDLTLIDAEDDVNTSRKLSIRTWHPLFLARAVVHPAIHLFVCRCRRTDAF